MSNHFEILYRTLSRSVQNFKTIWRSCHKLRWNEISQDLRLRWVSEGHHSLNNSLLWMCRHTSFKTSTPITTTTQPSTVLLIRLRCDENLSVWLRSTRNVIVKARTCCKPLIHAVAHCRLDTLQVDGNGSDLTDDNSCTDWVLTHWGRDKMANIFQTIFPNAFSINETIWISIKISLKFVHKGPINNIPALVQIMAWRRPGDKPLYEPMMVSLLTHICATRPQWVNTVASSDIWPQVVWYADAWLWNHNYPKYRQTDSLSYHLQEEYNSYKRCLRTGV